MLSYRDISSRLQEIHIPPGVPLLIHANMTPFGEIHGGLETMLGSLFSISDKLIFPTFTYKTMIIPEEGLPYNGMYYGRGRESNALAEIFNADMPADVSMGKLAEKFRSLPHVTRSTHPILSFCGINVEDAITTQTISEPLTLLRKLSENNAWILLMGVDHTSNISIHYAELLAGRKQFVRWALTDTGVVECPDYPGCPMGFNQIAPVLQEIIRNTSINNISIQAMPLNFLVDVSKAVIQQDPSSLLCTRPNCLRCHDVRYHNEHPNLPDILQH